MADETKNNSKTCADADAKVTLASENAGKSDDSESEDVVQHDDTDEAAGSETPGEDAVHGDAEDELDNRLCECCGQTPLEAEGNGDNGAWEHGDEGDGTAKWHVPDLDEAQDCGESYHDGTDSKLLYLGFCCVH